MLKVLSSILCDLDPKVKVIGQKAGICDGVPSTSALVLNNFLALNSFYRGDPMVNFNETYNFPRIQGREGGTYIYQLGPTFSRGL